jgi:DUF4097 and DUF4098 domain-containing protein YvlB
MTSMPSFARLYVFLLVSAALLSSASLARADGSQSTVTATTDAVIRVQVRSGSVTVVGWAKHEVGVRTTSGDASVSSSDGGSRVDVRGRHGGDDTVEVSVPAGSTVDVRTVEASITVRGVTGPVDVESVEGDLDVSGAPSDVEARSVSGRVRLSLAKADVRASSVNGTIDVRLPNGGTASLRNVSGTTHLEGAHLTRVEARSVAGDVGLSVDLQGSGPFVARTHSGGIHVVLPKGSTVTVDARSSRGHVDGAGAGTGAPDAGHSSLSVYSFDGAIDVVRR